MSMNVTEVRFTRIKSLGNYENEKLEVAVAVEAGDDIDKTISELKLFVSDKLGLGPSEEELAEAEETLRRAGRL